MEVGGSTGLMGPLPPQAANEPAAEAALKSRFALSDELSDSMVRSACPHGAIEHLTSTSRRVVGARGRDPA